MNQPLKVVRTILGASLSILFAWSAEAASPSLTGVRPLGGRRGTEVEVNLTGARLGDAQEVFFYQPGISTTKLQVVADNHVKVTFKIEGDCPLGLHDIRLRTATGIS